MTPSYWYSPAAAFLWQIALHSLIAGLVFYAWLRHLRLASGSTRRWMLGAVLTVPLVTALIPGRNGFDFREQTAWFDSVRLFPIPLYDGIRLYHLLLALAALCVVVSLWQEVVPVFRRLNAELHDPPARLLKRIRALPDWEHCRVGILAADDIFLATDGWPSRPRLLISRGALEQLADAELEAVFRHEHAHWRRGRWHASLFLFVVRLVQLHNPVALWVFREYSMETEIDCDADAVAGHDPKHLARALLKVYESTDARDISVRSRLRKRVDILLGRIKRVDDDLPVSSILAAALTLVLLLPWIV